ncbi:butyrate kinase [Hathewaya proteolytica DSM 3090]|uniref:Butyrate kinase n=1 Tax=Hathewaya proteolytica DSM 3090 TaxID=1121331 RepID=A0A1M6RFE8_9CLOT|nr:butyrate kinase [Hathewaya proteolytica]SHK31130.1 butyrate kinase [Hathewaya proteolytica DSM 3090]
MAKKQFILAISPHNLYTKISVLNKKGMEVVSSKVQCYNPSVKMYSQRDFRVGDIIDELRRFGITLGELICTVGTGGILRPMPGGTYFITPKLLEDIRIAYGGGHITNLGALIAFEIAKKANIKAYMVDSMSVDEMPEEARITGLPYIKRTAISYALDMKYIGTMVAEKICKNINDSSFIVCQMNEEVSTIALKNGKIVDAVNFYDEGVFSIKSCGDIPPLKLASKALEYKGDYKSFCNEMYNQSGLLQLMEFSTVERLKEVIMNDIVIEEYRDVMEAFSYGVAKDIGTMASALSFKVDRIILTGDLCASHFIMDNIARRVSFISPVEVIQGNYEIEAMFNGVKRVLDNIEQPKIYENEVDI